MTFSISSGHKRKKLVGFNSLDLSFAWLFFTGSIPRSSSPLKPSRFIDYLGEYGDGNFFHIEESQIQVESDTSKMTGIFQTGGL